MVDAAYKAGFSNVKETQVSFDNSLQEDAFRAGKYDRAMDVDEILVAEPFKASEKAAAEMANELSNKSNANNNLDNNLDNTTTTETENKADIENGNKQSSVAKPKETAEEKRARQERMKEKKVAQQKKLFGLKSPEQQEYLNSQYNKHRDTLENLKQGDLLVDEDGNVVAEVSSVHDETGIMIYGEHLINEIPVGFLLDDTIPGFLEMGYKFVSKTNDSTTGTATETLTEIETTQTPEDKNQYEIMDELGLTYEEQHAILDYKGSESYKINKKLRKGIVLSENDKRLVELLNTALDKFEKYRGVVYRNIALSNESKFNEFISKYSKSDKISYSSFLSASKITDGYIVDAEYKVHYEIQSKSASDVEMIGLKEEREVLFKPNTEFKIKDIQIVGKTVNITLEEESKSEITGTKHNGYNTQSTEERNIETEHGTEREGVSSGTSALRGRSSADDRVSNEEPDSVRERSDSESGRNNVRSNEETWNDSDTEGPSVSANVNTSNVTSINKQNMPVSAEETVVSTKVENSSVTEEIVDKDKELPEEFKLDEDGEIRFEQMDIDDTNTTKSNKVLSAVEKTIKPEIVSNAELMGMLADKFGDNGIDGLVNEIITRYNRDKTIGDFENLFTDGGKEIYDALRNHKDENVNYSFAMEREEAYEGKRNLLHDDSEQWYAREYPGEQVAGLVKATEIGSKTAKERKDFTSRLKLNQLEKKIVTDREGNKHTFFEIKLSAWNNQMNKIADYYAQKSVNVHFIKGGVQIAFVGEDRTANAMRIGNDIYISYDNAWFTPEQLSMHEYIHIKYDGNPEFQKTVQDILEILPKREYNRIVEKVKKAYGDIIDNPYAYEEELICDVLSGMTPSSLLKSGEIVLKFWARESIDVQGYDTSQYAESIDAGGINEIVLNNVMFTDENQMLRRGDIAVSVDEYAQLSDFIIDENYSNKIKSVSGKEIGNNFYVWRNNGKNKFRIEFVSPIGVNNDFVEFYRNEVINNDGEAETIWKMYSYYYEGQGDGIGGRTYAERNSPNGRNDEVSQKEFREWDGIDGRGNSGESNRDTVETDSGIEPKINYALSSHDSDVEFWEEWLNLVKEYGAIPSGENPHREVQVPRKTAEAGIHLLPIFLLITAK